MFREAAVAAVALAGHVMADAYSLQKRDGAHGHGHDHGNGHDHAAAPSSGYEEPSASYGAPAASYGAPAASYGAPAASYGAPAASYGAPAASYGAPAASYGAPAASYGAPAPSYGGGVAYDEGGDAALPDLTPIIIGILAIIGLSLLFPTFVSLTTVRRKRSAAEESNPMSDVVDRVNDIYGAVVQSEECMERIACELGGLAADVGLKSTPLTDMADPFVPSKYKAYMKQFQSGTNCQKIKCGKLF